MSEDSKLILNSIYVFWLSLKYMNKIIVDAAAEISKDNMISNQSVTGALISWFLLHVRCRHTQGSVEINCAEANQIVLMSSMFTNRSLSFVIIDLHHQKHPLTVKHTQIDDMGTRSLQSNLPDMMLGCWLKHRLSWSVELITSGLRWTLVVGNLHGKPYLSICLVQQIERHIVTIKLLAGWLRLVAEYICYWACRHCNNKLWVLICWKFEGGHSKFQKSCNNMQYCDELWLICASAL